MASQNESLTLTREQKEEIENLFNFNSKWFAMTQEEPASNVFGSACKTIVAMLRILGVSDIETISAEVNGAPYEKISLN